MRNSHPLAYVAAVLWPVLAAALCFGQTATTQPGVAADPVVAGAATVSAQAPAPGPIAADARIAVLPFVAIDPQSGNAWVGKSVQQSISADLLQAAPGRVQTADKTANSTADAAAAGQQLGVNYVIFGTYGSTDSALRIVGQVVDCNTGTAVGSLKVTGKLGDVFVLEDGLSRQARARLFGQTAADDGPGYSVHALPDTGNSNQTYYPPNNATATPDSSTGYAYPAQTQTDAQYQSAYTSSPSVYYSYPVYSYSYYSYPYYSYPYCYSYPYWGYSGLYFGLGYYGGHYRYGGWGGGYRGGFGGGFHGSVGGAFHGSAGGGFHGGGGGHR